MRSGRNRAPKIGPKLSEEAKPRHSSGAVVKNRGERGSRGRGNPRRSRHGVVFCQDEFRAFFLQIVIHLAEGFPNEVDAQAAGLDKIQGATLELIRLRLAAEITQTKADTAIERFADEADELIRLLMVRVANDIGAGFVEPQHHQILIQLGKGKVLEKLPHEIPNQGKVRRMTRKLDLAPHPFKIYGESTAGIIWLDAGFHGRLCAWG